MVRSYLGHPCYRVARSVSAALFGGRNGISYPPEFFGAEFHTAFIEL